MRIAVIGTGALGSALARGWRQAAHDVVLASRDPQSRRAVDLGVELGVGVGAVAEAVRNADVAALATPWSAIETSIGTCGDLGGKVLLDATNPLKPGLAGLALGFETSGGERVATLARGARVVKIFNTIGASHMANASGETMFYAGDDAAAKGVAAGLARDLGFTPVDVGALREARLLEPLAMLWITLAYKQGLGPEISLQLVRP
ncbi:MAG: NADPH-dependent F420 reductase [Candidatus Schekmanbacteria bacterium]|nr:NADPH-dependent F420 reductase [Candidatus Schekmanbacteria bacterium]